MPSAHNRSTRGYLTGRTCAHQCVSIAPISLRTAWFSVGHASWQESATYFYGLTGQKTNHHYFYIYHPCLLPFSFCRSYSGRWLPQLYPGPLHPCQYQLLTIWLLLAEVRVALLRDLINRALVGLPEVFAACLLLLFPESL